MGMRFAHQFLDAVDLSSIEPSFFWKISVAQARAEILQLVFQVCAHEEIGIRKAGAHHVFVALPDQIEAFLSRRCG